MAISKQGASRKNAHLALKITIEVQDAAEQFYPESYKLGEHAAAVITNRHRSQLTNLENVAASAFKTSDIFDYIKRQTARYDYWRRPHSQHSQEIFGVRLLNILSKDLEKKHNTICNKLAIQSDTDEGRHLYRHVYLLLIRQFIQQMVVQYEFSANLSQEEKESMFPQKMKGD
ncbi:hypothetical protein [Dictyobacter aurantiacus]|uniref:Uncharacterized protein n=1 Tax=Dictyobacter aurantiacus TaxID=1936993 RepID=A0A401ZQZ1_9CHLR|nr:hypothetical protein [Dictyobacter aurantiacus]GCE09297.1 hypothetical protein KDAU_66260 [Dictyobacter aurantiacus]